MPQDYNTAVEHTQCVAKVIKQLQIFQPHTKWHKTRHYYFLEYAYLQTKKKDKGLDGLYALYNCHTLTYQIFPRHK